MIQVAAVGDIHFGPDAAGTLRPHLEHLNERADLLLLAGDLTRVGAPDEARALADELAGVAVPMVGVLNSSATALMATSEGDGDAPITARTAGSSVSRR